LGRSNLPAVPTCRAAAIPYRVGETSRRSERDEVDVLLARLDGQRKESDRRHRLLNLAKKSKLIELIAGPGVMLVSMGCKPPANIFCCRDTGRGEKPERPPLAPLGA
jgi:hypothetical protein